MTFWQVVWAVVVGNAIFKMGVSFIREVIIGTAERIK